MQIYTKNSVNETLNQRAEAQGWKGQDNETRILVDSRCIIKGDQCDVEEWAPKPKVRRSSYRKQR